MHIRQAIYLCLILVVFLSSCGPEPTGTTPVSTPSLTASPEAPSTVEPTIESPLIYLDSTRPISERVADLLQRMTLAEKIGQMTQVEMGSIRPAAVTTYAIGSVLSGGGGTPTPNTPEKWLDMVNEFQDAALQTRLAIPLLYGVDAVHGHNNVKGATIFPHNIGLGAAGDELLVQRIARATAVEMAATGIRWNFAPVIAVVQDIRWGRTYEAYGGETDLVTRLGTSYLYGLQEAGDGHGLANPLAVLATPKHFIGDGGTAWGSSLTAGYQLDQGDMRVDEAVLRQLYLPPYQAAIQSGARSIMVSFSSWNGEKLHAHQYLLTDVLKGELGFTGFIVSDWQAIDQLPGNYESDVVNAINAGLDMIMVPYDYQTFINTMTMAVEQGDISEVRIDDAVSRILTVKFELGLFEQPYTDPSLLDQVGSEEHRALARQAVARSLVLLKNDEDLLPLSKENPVIFVAGEAADDIGYQSGGWTIEWQGRTGAITPGTTILEGIRATVQTPEQLVYNRFGNFEDQLDASGNPQQAAVGIVVVGEQPYAEGMGDDADLTLHDRDLQIIERVRARSDRLVIILLSGRPMVVTAQIEQADAFVAAWLPGSEGQGVVDALFGDQPFSGRLPFAWPRSADQLPLPADSPDALFPAGYGLQTAGAWQLVWQDEFNGEVIDLSNWTFNLGGGGWGNGEDQYYTDRPENARLENGYLVIEARREDFKDHRFTSARMKTQGLHAWTYGRIEARMRIPSGQGIWPAFWMLGSNINARGWPFCGEIDIMEHVGKEPFNIHHALHGPGYSGGENVGGFKRLAFPANAAFHVFAIEWEADEIRWYIDGELIETIRADSVPGDWVYDHDFFILLNVAVGGYWPGAADETTVFPQQLLVDYVRVFQTAPTENQTQP